MVWTDFTRAGRVVSTATRSASRMASSRSWVTNSTAVFCVRPELQHFLLHQFAGLHVERRERLVHQQHLRIVDEGLRQRHALAHAARQLMRVCSSKPFSPTRMIQSRAVASALSFGHAANSGPASHCRHVAPRKHRVLLEHEADAPDRRRSPARRTTDFALAAGQARRSAQHRRLAAAGRAHHGQNSPGAMVRSKSSSAERTSPRRDEAPGDVFQGDGGGCGGIHDCHSRVNSRSSESSLERRVKRGFVLTSALRGGGSGGGHKEDLAATPTPGLSQGRGRRASIRRVGLDHESVV